MAQHAICFGRWLHAHTSAFMHGVKMVGVAKRSTMFLLVGAAMLLAGCQHAVKSGGTSVGTTDSSQIHFYQAFCEALIHQPSSDHTRCDDYIYPPSAIASQGSEARATMSGHGAPGKRPTLVFVPGIFGQCVSPWVSPFSDAYSTLQHMGYRILVAPVDGRSSAEHNAVEIDQFLRANTSPGEHLIVFGYSKGATDFMTALALRPSPHWTEQVDAFVSVAGVIRGTPLADAHGALYDHWLADLPFPTCQAGMGDAMRSMSVPYREQWLVSHELPGSVRYFSVAAVAAGTKVNPLLLPFWRELTDDGLQNDGQVTPAATYIPQGSVLGVMKGDHWSIALPFESSNSPLMAPFKIDNHFPRTALIQAILSVIAE